MTNNQSEAGEELCRKCGGPFEAPRYRQDAFVGGCSYGECLVCRCMRCGYVKASPTLDSLVNENTRTSEVNE